MLAFAAVSGLGVTGCLGYEDDQVQLGEDFEGCGACTWTRTGDVTIVTTNHPGEHAARLGVDAALSHDLAIERTLGDGDGYDYGGDNFSDGNWLEYSSDCTGTPGLALEPLGSDIAIRLRLEAPAGDAFARRKVMLPAIPAAAVPPDVPDDPYDPYDGVSVTFRRLTIETGAPCRLDNLRLMVSGGTLGY